MSQEKKSEEEKGNKKFLDTCNHCGKAGHKAANGWKHKANKDKRPKNWKKKEDKEVGASNIEVLFGCTKTSAIEYEMVRFCSKLIFGNLSCISLTR